MEHHKFGHSIQYYNIFGSVRAPFVLRHITHFKVRLKILFLWDKNYNHLHARP